MKTANPYLNFNGNTEEAFNYYKAAFGAEFAVVMRFRDFPDNPMNVADDELDKIAHIALPLGAGGMLMGTDVLMSRGQPATVGNNFHIALDPESAEEAERVFKVLAAGGKIDMPLRKTEWAQLHGQCRDKFGVQWMIDYTGDVQFPG